MGKSPFTARVIEIIRAIPFGKVCTYGGVAKMAGSPRAARQVVRVLHTQTEAEELPWHRVVNREGRIALKPMQGYEKQKRLLETEGVLFSEGDTIDLRTFLWRPSHDLLAALNDKEN